MNESILVAWIGDCYRPTVYRVSLSQFNIDSNTIDKDKIYLIDDMVYLELLKCKHNVDVYAKPYDNYQVFNTDDSLDLSNTINTGGEFWKQIKRLLTELYNGTTLLNDYIDEVEECIYHAFSREHSNNIEFLTLSEKSKHAIHIGYISAEESLMVYFTEYNSDIKVAHSEIITAFELHDKIGSVLLARPFPMNIHSPNLVRDHLNELIEKNSFFIKNSDVEKASTALVTFIDYLFILDETSLPTGIKNVTKAQAIKSAFPPKFIVIPTP